MAVVTLIYQGWPPKQKVVFRSLNCTDSGMQEVWQGKEGEMLVNTSVV